MMTHVYERFEAVEKKVNALASDVAKLDARLREVEATAFPPKHPTRVYPFDCVNCDGKVNYHHTVWANGEWQEVSRCGKCDAEFLGECLTVEEEAEAKATKPASPPDKWPGVRVFYNERVDSYFVPILKKKWHGGTWFYSVSTVEDCIRFKNRELHDPERTAWLDAHPLPKATEQQLHATGAMCPTCNGVPASPPDKWSGVSVFVNLAFDGHWVFGRTKAGEYWNSENCQTPSGYDIENISKRNPNEVAELHDPKRTAWLDAHPLPKATEPPKPTPRAILAERQYEKTKPVADASPAEVPISLIKSFIEMLFPKVAEEGGFVVPMIKTFEFHREALTAWLLPDLMKRAEKAEAELAKYREWMDAEGHPTNLMVESGDYPQAWDIWYEALDTVGVDVCGQSVGDRLDGSEEIPAPEKAIRTILHMLSDAMYEAGLKDHELTSKGLATIAKELVEARAELAKVKAQRDALNSVGEPETFPVPTPSPDSPTPSSSEIVAKLPDLTVFTAKHDPNLGPLGPFKCVKYLGHFFYLYNMTPVSNENDWDGWTITDPHPITVAELPDGATFEVLLSGHWIERRVCNGNVEDADGNLSTPQTSDAYRGKEIRNVSLPVKGGTR